MSRPAETAATKISMKPLHSLLLWWAGWLANRLPPRLTICLPEPILRAAYRQLWHEWEER